MSNDYFKAQGWFKTYALNSQDSRGMFQRLVEQDEREFKLASAETDRIKAMINKKYGPGSMKYGSQIPQPDPRQDVIEIDAINSFMRRNPAAEGGRMKFEKGLRVKDLTEAELVNAQSAARKAGITSKKGSEEFANFVGGDTYKRASTIEAERAADLGIDLETYKKMSKKEKTKLYNTKYNKATKAKSGNVVGDTVEEIVIQLQNGGTFSKKQKEKKMLYDTYSKLFREEFDKLKNLDEPFTKSDLTKRVITRVEELYTTKDGYFNEEFLPTRDLSEGSARSWYDFIEPSAKSDKKKGIFSADELKLFSQKGTGLNKTKTQAKIFDLLADGVNEVDDIAKALGMPVGGNKTRITYEIEKMLTNMFSRRESDVPAFLNEARKAKYSDIINALESSNSLDGYYRRNIYSTIEETFKGDAQKIKLAKQKIRDFNKFKKNLATQFPGLEINYDHPASYRALKNQNLGKFMNITPIMKDINTFKSQFDLRSQLNLQAMEEARTAGNMDEYKRLLKNQRGIEKLWSNLTGGQSTLGKVRLGKATNLGTTALLDESKDLIKEFEGNLKIRDNIAKNLNEDTITQFKKLFPVVKGETKLIERAKKITSPNLIDFDKKVMAYITDTTGKVKQPMFSSGFSGAYEMLSDDLKAIVDSEGFKKFKANIANPALTTAVNAAKLPTKIFGAADLVLGYLDYSNNRQKGFSKEDSTKHMVDAILFGATSLGEKADIEGVKKIAMQNGMSEEVFNNLVNINTNQKAMINRINESKAKFNESMDIIESGTADPVTEKLLIQKLKVDTKKFLTNTMKDIVDDSRSLQTNLQVQEAGAPIDINVDTQKAFSDLGSASREFVQKRIDASDLEKIANQKDTTKGGIGDAVMSGLKATYTQPKFIYDLINPLSPLPKAKDFFPKDLNYKAQMEQLKKEDPTMYYKMLMSEGVDPRINLNIPVQLEFEQNYPQFGTQYSDALTQNKAEGGITTLRSKYEYKK